MGKYRQRTAHNRAKHRKHRPVVEARGKSRASRRLVSDLGWTQEEAAETSYRLRAFEEDWNSPSMEAYDAL